jgi:hypothetical protein
VNRRRFCRASLALLLDSRTFAGESSAEEAIVRPKEYSGALRNPLKGLRSGDPASAKKLPYATLAKCYIRWNDIENSASDGVERIQEFCGDRWRGLPEINTKVVPRVYLDWPPNGHFWPADMSTGDYSSPQFMRRVVALIEKLGEAWDNDPRVAFVETGIVGLWGEQHDPEPSPELQKVIGDAYTANFCHKLLMNRYPLQFTEYRFGIYWDSFGHKEEAPRHIALLKSPRLCARWKIAPMGGETAFDWGTPLGKNPTDALEHNADTIVSLIRDLHWNHLGWLSEYDQDNPVAAANATLVQQSLGYRFVLDEVRFPLHIDPGEPFRVSILVHNTGSSPFYYRWPVELSLLDPDTRTPRWQSRFPDCDLRMILPAASSTRIAGEFTCPPELPRGCYLLALAIPDPAGDMPAARFATTHYFRGGRHPMGWIGVGMPARRIPMPEFDDPAQDHTLGYRS